MHHRCGRPFPPQRLYDLLVRDIVPPDLVVYLQTPTEVLRSGARAAVACNGSVVELFEDP